MELLIGAGNSREKKLWHSTRTNWSDLVTLDIDGNLRCDVTWDLNKIPLPFPDNSADEIHAYEVLEHVGKQGDWRFFLDQFADFWRILKPNGVLFGTVPMWNSIWAWGDPGHTRVISLGSLSFLSQKHYEKEIKDAVSPMTDYRPWYKADFDLVHSNEYGEILQFALKAIKEPS